VDRLSSGDDNFAPDNPTPIVRCSHSSAEYESPSGPGRSMSGITEESPVGWLCSIPGPDIDGWFDTSSGRKELRITNEEPK
jgi:hypothetical protein